MQLVRAYTALARNGDVIDLTFRRTSKEAVGKLVSILNEKHII